jgi:hypothetical protein
MSYSYRDQLEIISDIHIKEGQEHRGNCPFCGGRNTFTLTKKNGDLVWNCYRASCGVRGGKSGVGNVDSIKRRLSIIPEAKRAYPPLPPIFTSIHNQPSAMRWLETRHCMEALDQGMVSIRYSPSDDRICFLVHSNSTTLDGKNYRDEDGMDGWTGRGRKGIIPKWKKYGDCNHLFTCGSGTIGVVVEDPCSACAVGVIESYSGAALLGTNLSAQLKYELLARYDELIICLDPDAALKGLQMMSALSGLIPTRLVVPKDDLKYFNKDQIKEMLNGDTTT